MDEFVQKKLKEWNLAELIPTFEAQQIDKDTFFLLDENSLASLIPLVGPRLKFLHNLKQLLENSSPQPVSAVGTSAEDLPAVQHTEAVKQHVQFNIRDILNKTADGKGLVTSLEESHHISLNQRRCMVRILVSHLMERFGENPTSDKKTMLASAIVDQFPCLRDPLGSGFDAWFTPGRNHKPATGFLEERLRNVRKRLRSGTRRDSAEGTPKETRTIVPESLITAERAVQMTEWLKNNIRPLSQVVQYMHETATHRAQWIRACGTVPMSQIIAEFPRLLDTPGMISQDFSILHPENSVKLTENWRLVFAEKIIQMAKKEKTSDILLNLEMAGKEGDIAMLLLPVLLPAAPYKLGKKVFRPSSLESRTAFIDVQPPGTNMVEYLSRTAMESPHVLMLGEECECSQAFVILNGTALEQPSLLGAVDTCFKAYYVFDLVYPKPCAQVWEFIQSVVFEMPGDVSNVVKLLRAQLNAML